MASGDELLARMLQTPSGWNDRDFHRVLEYYGYALVRHARHGAIFRHPDLASHPDQSVRQLMIPSGRELPRYVARKVVKSVQALLELQNGSE